MIRDGFCVILTSEKPIKDEVRRSGANREQRHDIGFAAFHQER